MSYILIFDMGEGFCVCVFMRELQGGAVKHGVMRQCNNG